MNSKFMHEEQQRRRDLEHAKWRVSFGEFMLQSHQLLILKDSDWERKQKELGDRLESAKEELARLSSNESESENKTVLQA